jgi:hypothetical protein
MSGILSMSVVFVPCIFGTNESDLNSALFLRMELFEGNVYCHGKSKMSNFCVC